MIGFKIIQKVDGQRSEAYISVAQTESLFECLADKIGDPANWTKLHVHENGVCSFGWRLVTPYGCYYPARGFQATLDAHFQRLFTRQERPTQEIYVSHRGPIKQ
jgi:hypothetical protein